MKPFSRRNILTQAMASIAAMASGSVLLASMPAHARSSKQHRIAIREFRFTPELLGVKPGDTIIWTNHDIAPHTATAEDKSWDTGTIVKGKSKEILVTKTFSPNYFCRFHPMMKAKLKGVRGY